MSPVLKRPCVVDNCSIKPLPQLKIDSYIIAIMPLFSRLATQDKNLNFIPKPSGNMGFSKTRWFGYLAFCPCFPQLHHSELTGTTLVNAYIKYDYLGFWHKSHHGSD
jgi:hypothetical protein